MSSNGLICQPRSPSTTQRTIQPDGSTRSGAPHAQTSRHAPGATVSSDTEYFPVRAASATLRNELPLTLPHESKTQRLMVVVIKVTQVKPNAKLLVPSSDRSRGKPKRRARGTTDVRQVHTPSISRWWAAKSANSTRLDAPSLLKMWVRCDLTVFSVIDERAAISRFE
jgi:hypothetical protein